MFQCFKTNFNHGEVYDISTFYCISCFQYFVNTLCPFWPFLVPTSNAFTFDDGYVSLRTQTNISYQWLRWEVSRSCPFVCQNRSIFDNSAFSSLAFWPPWFFEVSATLFITSLDINDNITNKPAIDYISNLQNLALKDPFLKNFLLFQGCPRSKPAIFNTWILQILHILNWYNWYMFTWEDEILSLVN